MYLWLSYLKPQVDSVSTNHAGSMISGVTAMRQVIDQGCAAEGGDLFPIATQTITMFGQAMMQNPGTRRLPSSFLHKCLNEVGTAGEPRPS